MDRSRLESLPDYLGHLVLKSDGALLYSGGVLDCDETTAERLVKLISAVGDTSSLIGVPQALRISIVYEDHYYVVCRSNNHYYILLRASEA